MDKKKFNIELKKINLELMNEKVRQLDEKVRKLAKEPLLRFDLREIFAAVDIYTLAILAIYTLLAIIFYKRIVFASNLILINAFIASAIITICTLDEKMKAGRLFTIIRKMYIVPLVFFIYSQVQYYVKVINPADYDSLLILWDKAIFGVNPTQWMQQISFPALTEYLQLCYMTYFFAPLIHGIELYRKPDEKNFFEFSRILMFSFYLSYLLYLIMPAIGPRFTLHNFFNINLELPGVFLTNFLRELVNIGGGIPYKTLTPELFVNKDCMPSGHTWITLVNIYLGFRFISRFRWFFLLIGLSLILGTVYLRYHYVIDVIIGAFLGILTLLFEPKIYKLIKKGWNIIR